MSLYCFFLDVGPQPVLLAPHPNQPDADAEGVQHSLCKKAEAYSAFEAIPNRLASCKCSPLLIRDKKKNNCKLHGIG